MSSSQMLLYYLKQPFPLIFFFLMGELISVKTCSLGSADMKLFVKAIYSVAATLPASVFFKSAINTNNPPHVSCESTTSLSTFWQESAKKTQKSHYDKFTAALCRGERQWEM